MTHRDIAMGAWNRNWDKEVHHVSVVDVREYSHYEGLALLGHDKSDNCWSAHPFPYDAILVLFEVSL